jgi:hypothetical protein
MKNLDDIRKENPFKVPDNYFEDVNRKIISATLGEEEGVRKISLYNRFRTTILIAASITGFIIISYSALKLLAPDKTHNQVSEAIYEMNQDSLVNDLDISSLEESASSLALPEEGPDVSKKDIIDYLMLDNIEINDIYEQL